VIDDAELDELSRAFDELGAAMRRGRARSAADSASGLSPAQFELLRALRDHEAAGGLRVSVLAGAAGLAMPSVTRMLKQTERRGLVERRPSETDGRATLVELTHEGRRRVQTYQADLQAKQRLTFSTFDAHERQVLLRSLRRLTALADEHSDYAGPSSGRDLQSA
jgi:MarR family transcriptional regulator, organic hydroperoxide resistance regulator